MVHEKISIGDVAEVPVYAQKWAYLNNRLGRTLNEFIASGSALSGAGVAAYAGAGAYKLLCTLVPNFAKFVPEWKWMGYGSQSAMDAGVYDEDEDHSPTFPEIVTAFETVIRVNRFDLVKELRHLVDPQTADLIRKKIRVDVATAISESSPESPSPSGASAPTSSSTTRRTRKPKKD